MTLLDSATILMGYWPLIISAVAVISWLIRLEYRVLGQGERIKELEVHNEEITKLRITVERIDARLSVLLPDYDGKK